MGDPKVLRFLQLLVSRGFVEETAVDIGGLQKKLFRFGPLGALLRKNILKQWWDAIVLKEPNTFYVEMPPLVPQGDVLNPDKVTEHLQLLQCSNLRTSLSSDCTASYLSALKLTNGQLPVSVASSGQCFQLTTAAEQTSTDSNNRLLSNGLSETQLLLQHYSPPASAAQTLDYWLRNRLRWWRQFSSNPSKFSTSTVSHNSSNSGGENNGQTAIEFTFPWGTETVETVCNHGDTPLLGMETSSGVSYKGQYHQKKFHPHLFECQTSVEQCMSVFLTDAYREHILKQKGSKRKLEDIRSMLQLHPLLSPYKVALSVTGSRSREVRVLTERVAKELREAGISVLSLPANSLTMDSQFRRNDEMGVPYTVVMSDQTLDSGVITFRNRDTRMKQQEHISKLQSLLLRNLSGQELT